MSLRSLRATHGLHGLARDVRRRAGGCKKVLSVTSVLCSIPMAVGLRDLSLKQGAVQG